MYDEVKYLAIQNKPMLHWHVLTHTQVWCKNMNHSVASTEASYCGIFVTLVLQSKEIPFIHTHKHTLEQHNSNLNKACERS